MKNITNTPTAEQVIKSDETTYTERSDLARRESVRTLADEGCSHYNSGISDFRLVEKHAVNGMNNFREAGRKFKQAEEIGQYEFKMYEPTIEGWRRESERKHKVRLAIKVYSMMPKKAETFAEVAATVQLGLLASELIELGKRDEEVAHPPQIPLNAWLSGSANNDKWAVKMEAGFSHPEEYYRSLTVDTLLDIKQVWQPTQTRIAIVDKILAEKGVTVAVAKEGFK
jgi:hypothetical protein